jgi:hypothetical protein
MRARHVCAWLALFFGICVLIGGGANRARATSGDSKQDDDQAAPAVGGVRIGMTTTRVLELLGKPARVSRQILFRRHVEQWIYAAPTSLWIEFQGVRGQEARVTSVHPLSWKKP